jgi:peroxiredoxin
MGFTLEIGAKAPDFCLKGIDGAMHTLAEYSAAKALVVIVSCNHCPTVIACEDRMIAIQRDYADRGVQFVVINGNETDGHPTDSYEHMINHATEKGYNFPYLRDDSQETVRALGAVRTPEVFLFDAERMLVYHGRIDDSPDEPDKVNRHDLREALEEVLADKPVSVPQTVSVGCTVKWWGKDPHWMPEG